MGWGDYGSFSYTNALVGWNKQSTTYGFDILLGAMYSYKQFDVFFKAGALIENAVIKVDQNLGNQVIGGVVLGQVSSNASNTTIVPTIKAGGIYNINDSIGATVSYIYATGGKLQGSVYQSVGLGSSVTYGITATQLPSFSAVTFGLLYKF